jgi:hypothetical protein
VLAALPLDCAAPRPLALALLALLALAFTGVPDQRVLTPEGLRLRALVREVGEHDQVVELDGVARVVSAGLLDQAPDRALLDGAADEDQGWITFTWWTNRDQKPLRSFSTTWRVPPPPASSSGQTIFLFNGLQNTGPGYGILQPVLQWGPSAAGGGRYWSVASWYVTSRGQAFHTPLVRVQPGDELVGVMELLGERDGKLSYSCELRGLPRTRLRLDNVAELTWSTESLEAYGVRRCSDYPAAPSVPFTGIQLRTDESAPLRWTAVDRVTDYGQHAEVVSHSASDGQVDLFFH